MQKKFIYLTSLALGCNALTPIDVAAQELETVRVTATRSDTRLHDLPLSAAVLDSATLQIENPDHPAEVLNLVPGVNLHRGSGAEHLTAVRSPVLTGGAGAGSFLYLQNGVPLRSAGFANANGLLDAQYEFAQQIEVVRGPSGPAHGANAVHGLFNVVTPQPGQLDNNRLQLSGDSQQRYKGRGLFASTAAEQAWLLGLAANNEGGYRDDAGLAQQKALLHHRYSGRQHTIHSVVNLNNLNQETAGFIFGEEALNDRQLRRENAFPFAYRDAQSAHWQSQITPSTHSLNSFTLTPFARWHRMAFLQHFLPSQAVETNGHWSMGVQSDWRRKLARGELSGGVDLEYTQGFLHEFQHLPTVFSYTQGLHYDYSVKSAIAAAFVQGNYFIGPNTQLLGGLRVDSTHYRYRNKTSTGIVGRFYRPPDRADAFATASPKIALQYQAVDNWSTYLSWARANRPPQTSDLYRLQVNQIDRAAKAERMDAVELGLKYGYGQRLAANIALYSMEKKNFFFRDADGFNVNNGRTRHRGLELDIHFNLSQHWQLISAVSFARHTYRFNRIVGQESETILLGNEVDTAPNVLANTRILWRPVAATVLEIQWQKVGAYYTDAANTHRYNGHDVVNLRLLHDFSDSTQVAVSLRNATGELYAERADFAFGDDRYFPGETETLALSLTKKL